MNDYRTLAHIAIENESLELVKLLHEFGFDFEMDDTWKRPAICYAVQLDSPEIARFLVSIGVKTDVKVNGGRGLGYLASVAGKRECLRLVVSELGIDINTRDA